MGEKVKEECAREEERRREECERVVGMRGLVSSSFLLNTIATKVSHNSYASVNLNDTVGEPIQQLSRGIQEPSRGIQEPSRGIQEPSRGIQEPASPPSTNTSLLLNDGKIKCLQKNVIFQYPHASNETSSLDAPAAT
jgi:hypothetical protein